LTLRNALGETLFTFSAMISHQASILLAPILSLSKSFGISETDFRVLCAVDDGPEGVAGEDDPLVVFQAVQWCDVRDKLVLRAPGVDEVDHQVLVVVWEKWCSLWLSG
jgi:hypothetical protein